MIDWVVFQHVILFKWVHRSCLLQLLLVGDWNVFWILFFITHMMFSINLKLIYMLSFQVWSILILDLLFLCYCALKNCLVSWNLWLLRDWRLELCLVFHLFSHLHLSVCCSVLNIIFHKRFNSSWDIWSSSVPKRGSFLANFSFGNWRIGICSSAVLSIIGISSLGRKRRRVMGHFGLRCIDRKSFEGLRVWRWKILVLFGDILRGLIEMNSWVHSSMKIKVRLVLRWFWRLPHMSWQMVKLLSLLLRLLLLLLKMMLRHLLHVNLLLLLLLHLKLRVNLWIVWRRLPYQIWLRKVLLRIGHLIESRIHNTLMRIVTY